MAGKKTGRTVLEFDISRATLSDKDTFKPFRVNTTRPLQEALVGGDVGEDTQVLVMEGTVGVLALLTRQMCYHHLAQGEMTGGPWMVSF